MGQRLTDSTVMPFRNSWCGHQRPRTEWRNDMFSPISGVLHVLTRCQDDMRLFGCIVTAVTKKLFFCFFPRLAYGKSAAWIK